ncbi:hypothetical protein T492DRAFT_514464 [Pavlovales sp. CCMP2436]|nr:hypothetical protein T492DRAFT_514464 [Pavlovales sp. CCMP2436]
MDTKMAAPVVALMVVVLLVQPVGTAKPGKAAVNARASPSTDLGWWVRQYSAERAAATDCAVCVAGVMRTLHHERTRANWEAAFLRPARRDLFVHIAGESAICAEWNKSIPEHDRNRKIGCVRSEGTLSRLQLLELASGWLAPLGLVEMSVRSEFPTSAKRVEACVGALRSA